MPQSTSVAPPRHIDELLLAASDVTVVDRATLSLWHFEQLLRPYLPSSAAIHEKPPDADDKEHGTAIQDATAELLPLVSTTVDLEEGMTVAAVAFAETTDAEHEPHTQPTATVEPEPLVLAPITTGGENARSSYYHQRIRRASITESEMSLDDDTEREPTRVPHARLSMATQVAVVYRRYRCVLCLDASPSALSIDVSSGKVFLAMLNDSIELFVRNLLRPMEVSGVPFVPEFHVSVMVQGAFVESLCVLVQGFVLDLSTADRLIQLVRERLTLLEDDWAATAALADGVDSSKHRASLSSILQNAVFALHSLPSGAAPLIVLVTDGVVDLRHAYTYDSLVMQLVRHDIQCHFLRIGGSPSWTDPHASFGFVPDVDLLDFVAQATSGSVLEYIALHQSWTAPPMRDAVKCMTTVQSSLLVRSSKVQAISAPILKLDMAWCASFDGNQYMPLRPYRMWREKVHEYRIQTDVHHIVEARVREGFAVNKVHVQKMQRLANGSLVKMPIAPAGLPESVVPAHPATKILLVFVLQWKQNVWLEYVISSTMESQLTLGRSRSSNTKTTVSSSGANSSTSGHSKKDPASCEWYVKVNVLADGEFLRAFEDSRTHRQSRHVNDVEISGSPTALHDFIRNVQDVDRVLLHLMTAAASVASATDTTSHFSFGSQANSHLVATATNKSQSSHPVFGIIGELSPVLWHRWFHVERFEVLAVVVDDPSPQHFYPRGVTPQVAPRNSTISQLRNVPNSRSRPGRRAGMSLEANAHPLLVGKDSTVERIRAAILRWSSQRLGKDLFLRFLSTESHRTDERSRSAATPTSIGGVAPLAKRRQQRSSLNSATLSAQINASLEQPQLQPRREARSKGALCFVRVEAKNHTLVIIHVAFFAASAWTRRETLAELRNLVATNESHSSATPGASGGGNSMMPPSSPTGSRKLVLCHRMLSRLLVTHETLTLEDTDNLPESSVDPDTPMIACCGGSELQLRSVFGAFMWHSCWKWRLARTNSSTVSSSLMGVMRHLHEARIRAGFWVLDWRLEEDGDAMRIASVIFGREILMEDENGHLKTSLIQYGITRTADNCLLTSFWMEPQYGFAKTTLARDATVSGQQDAFHSSLRHAVGHDAPLSKLAAGSLGDPQGPSAYLDEGKLLGLIRDFLFDSDRHLLSCLHTFETITNVQESSVEMSPQRYVSPPLPAIVGMPVDDEPLEGSRALAPAFSTARLLEASTRSSEHFLIYLERDISNSLDPLATDSMPTLSSANIYLYSMLERTLRSLSDCEVAWTDFNGAFVGDTQEQPIDTPTPTIASQLPLWFSRFDAVGPPRLDQRQLSHGRCFAKLLPNDTVVLSFLPTISTLARKKRPLLSPIDTPDKNGSNRKAGLAQWHQRQELRATLSVEVAEHAAAQSSMLKMSVSADDIVLYQERRQSFREGYKSWRMGHYQGARDDKSPHAGHSGGSLSPHQKVASFSEDYEFCDTVCRDAALGADFHLLVEKADGELGSGYFQVAFYECSLAQLTATLTAQPCYGQRDAREALLRQLFTRRVAYKPSGELPPFESHRTPPLNKRAGPTMFGSRAGAGVGNVPSPPSPLTVAVEAAGEDSALQMAVLHSSMTFRKKVKRAHEHNFSRGIYVTLRDGAPVQQSDLIQALSSCVEVPLDLDITLLYRMLQVDMIRATVPRSALRSSMIDMLSGKPIRDALKERLDESIEAILSTVFHGIAETKYFVFVGSESIAVEDVAGVVETEGDAVQLLVEDDLIGDSDKTSGLAQGIAVGTNAARGDGEEDTMAYDEAAAEATIDSRLEAITVSGDTTAGGGTLTDQEVQHQQQMNQEEDAELNKDVAAATSSFSSPFFFRFECRELVKELVSSRPRSTSSGMNTFELTNPTSKTSLHRTSSSKSILDPLGSGGNRPSGAVLPLWQKKPTGIENAERTDGVLSKAPSTGGISEIAEWAAKLSGPKIALRLVTLTLPNEQLLERTRGHSIGDDARHRNTSTKATPSELFSSLPTFQRQVLKRLRKSIKEWSSQEILRILRYVEWITPSISQLVQKLFRSLPDDCRTTVKYPLRFVSPHHESVDVMALLAKELQTGTETLQLVDCGGPYFVVDRASDGSYTVPYWAFLTVEGDHIVLQLHHQTTGRLNADQGPTTELGGGDRLSVLTSLHLAVNTVCKRVNQYVLLLQLHETRSCNELLLPADPGTISTGPPSPTSASTRRQRLSSSSSSSSLFFWPGQFECDRKYAAFFRLHERMVPSIALTTLCTQALEQFEVHNRRHVFVYRDRGGHVFYMKMSVASSDAVHQPATPSILLRQSSNNNSPLGGGSTPSGILLEVFGVCSAGEEVTQELCRLLERKLDETMQLILMKLLARNTKFQLSPSDLAFMCPPDASPASVTVYRMPSSLIPRSDASTALLFLCQTLGMTSYMRQLNTTPHAYVLVPIRYERQGSRSSTTSGRVSGSSPTGAEVIPDVQAIDTAVAVESSTIHDARVSHPALFGQDGKLSAGFFEGIASDAASTSPVFFSASTGEAKASTNPSDHDAAPTMLGHATFAVNLNSELRLSPGFLSRVGKGLAILRVEIWQCEGDAVDTILQEGSDVTPLDVGHAFSAVANDQDESSHLYVRCQLWVRGPIQVAAFQSVYEAHLRESVCDYAIEATIRNIKKKTKVLDDSEETVTIETTETTMPPKVAQLVHLLDASAKMASASVAKLALPGAIQLWDVSNIVTQLHKFLTASLPVQARPALFGSHNSQFVRIDATDAVLQERDNVKLIPMPPTMDYPSTATGLVPVPSGLVSSDSVQSELSEMDSVSSIRYSVGSSTIESLSSASLHGSTSSLVSIKEFTTSELMFHSMAKSAGAETAKASAPPVVQQRSFYYVISVSVTGGLVFHGYNLSQHVVDAMALHLARVMTWSVLRDRMLQGLLLQRGGIGYAAPGGAAVVQPRVLLANGGALHVAEYSVNYVAFQTTIVPILQAFEVLPKSVETINRFDLTSFGKLLKELGVQVIDKGELQRSRSRNLAPSRPGAEDAVTGRLGSMRSGIVPSSHAQRTVGGAVEKTLMNPRGGGGAAEPFPMKRGSGGGLTPAVSIGPTSGHPLPRGGGGTGGGANSTNFAKMRSNPTAANALMAARARARGGGIPGKMGGGPGVGGANRAAGEVAPWDLPVTNTKTPTATTAASAAQGGNRPSQTHDATGRRAASALPVPALARAGSNGAGGQPMMTAPKRPSGSPSTLGSMAAGAGRSSSDRKDAKAAVWRSILANTWGPHAKYYAGRNTFVPLSVVSERAKGKELDDTSSGRAADPLRHYGAAFQRQLQLTTSCSAASDCSMALFRRIHATPQDIAAIDVADDKAVQTMLQSGHVMFHQRFRVSYIERWEVVKIDDEYVEDGSNTGRLRALQASMDLVNLLSYKQEFVFAGNERVVAKLLTEHTVQAMCGKEGQAVREMKLQILKAVFHSRMDVVQRFCEQYATHLRSLGFHHLQLPTSRLGRKKQPSAVPVAGNGSASGSGSATPTRSSVDAFAADGEAFSEFFVHSGGLVQKKKGTRKGIAAATFTKAVENDALLLELKCDHTGVQVSVVLLNDQDLRQDLLGHQRHLDPTSKVPIQGKLVTQVSTSLRETLDTRALIYDFTIRFFHRCLLDWTLAKAPDAGGAAGSTSSLYNMVKGVRCFLKTYPRVDKALHDKSECALEAATVELPVRNLQSDCSESILVKILLRYIACHGSRYDVTDLTQFGTPDTIACHSAAGNFYSRQNASGSGPAASSSASAWSRGPGRTNAPGYSLLITTQELWKGTKRPKNSVLLTLVRSAPSSAILLKTDRAMHEAELFVKELFRTAAANYERDLLWSRLLHNDSQGAWADVVHALALPLESFRVDVGPQQLEECLRLSVCIPLEQIDPELSDVLDISDVCWQEFALRLRDVYAGQVREYQFDGQAACHFLLLCPDARDLMIHLTFPSGITSATLDGDANRVHIDICRREEPANHKFSLAQRRAITDFVNSVVHWLWRCLLYD